MISKQVKHIFDSFFSGPTMLLLAAPGKKKTPIGGAMVTVRGPYEICESSPKLASKARPASQESGKKLKQKQGTEQNPVNEISDWEGHYDIDGVSFEKEVGVIVASDASKDILKARK